MINKKFGLFACWTKAQMPIGRISLDPYRIKLLILYGSTTCTGLQVHGLLDAVVMALPRRQIIVLVLIPLRVELHLIINLLSLLRILVLHHTVRHRAAAVLY